MKRIVLIFIATACTALGLYAQPAPTYTLKSCLEQGLLNNYSLRIVRNEEQVSKNNATLGNAGYLPTLDLSHLSAEELAEQNITPSTIRLSIGTENIDDIIADLEHGFEAIK